MKHLISIPVYLFFSCQLLYASQQPLSISEEQLIIGYDVLLHRKIAMCILFNELHIQNAETHVPMHYTLSRKTLTLGKKLYAIESRYSIKELITLTQNAQLYENQIEWRDTIRLLQTIAGCYWIEHPNA